MDMIYRSCEDNTQYIHFELPCGNIFASMRPFELGAHLRYVTLCYEKVIRLQPFC